MPLLLNLRTLPYRGTVENHPSEHLVHSQGSRRDGSRVREKVVLIERKLSKVIIMVGGVNTLSRLNITITGESGELGSHAVLTSVYISLSH